MSETWHKLYDFTDIKYERTNDGIAKITINRPDVRNAFRPLTVSELKQAFDMARDESEIGVVILTGEGSEAFCSGGDQKVRGKAGYIDSKGVPRLNILDVQKQIRSHGRVYGVGMIDSSTKRRSLGNNHSRRNDHSQVQQLRIEFHAAALRRLQI